MKLFKLLFLYFLSFTGFLCYGDSFSNGVIVAQWGATNQNPYLKNQSMYYVVPAQKWNKLPDKIKIDVFKTEPEQTRAFFNSHGLDERDMVGHYIGSMGHVEADVMFGKVKMLDEIYTGMGMENHVFREGYNNGVVGEAFMAGSSMGDAKQIQWVGQQNWGMDVIKAMGMKEPKIRMIRALPFDTGVVDGFSATGIMAKTIGLEGIGVDTSYVANATMEAMQGMAGKMVFMKNNTDYVMAKMEEKGLGNNMIMPHQNLQFYLTEPIGGGGGGGAAILASMGIDTPEDYLELARRIRDTGMSYWQEALEKGQIETSNIPVMWFVAPSTNQVFDNPAFYEIWSKYFQ